MACKRKDGSSYVRRCNALANRRFWRFDHKVGLKDDKAVNTRFEQTVFFHTLPSSYLGISNTTTIPWLLLLRRPVANRLVNRQECWNILTSLKPMSNMQQICT
jgi:hypothetical protein